MRDYLAYPLAVLVILATVLFAWRADAQIDCRDVNPGQTLIAGNDLNVNFPADIAAGTHAYAGNNMWNNAQGFPGDTTVDGLTISGSDTACWDHGIVQGPMMLAKDPVTFYECDAEHGYSGTGECLPYHTTAAIGSSNPTIEVHGMRLAGWGDGISAGNPGNVYQPWIRVNGTLFDYTHDDGVEDDFCRRSFRITDSYFKRVFNVFATRSRGNPCESPDPDNRFMIIEDNLIHPFRFAHAYKERPGHGGVFKTDSGKNPDLYFWNNVVLLGPISGDQQQFYDPAETADCSGNVYLWDGLTNASGPDNDYNDMLAVENNGTYLTGLRNAFGGDACIKVVLREDVCGTCTSAQFLATDLPELGGKSWDDLGAEWQASHFPSQPACGMGIELALVLPALLWLRRNKA